MLKMDITIKPVHAVTSIKQSHELKGHLLPYVLFLVTVAMFVGRMEPNEEVL
jgi:hypothetical protein